MTIINSDGQAVAIHSWASRIDRPCMDRLLRLARWNRLAGPIAVMPDIHLGNEVCVGTVLVTQDCILPTAIGGDLGCGMRSQCFDVEARSLSREDLEAIVERIMQAVPTGRSVHRRPREFSEQLRGRELSTRSLTHQQEWLGSRHVGTLGGGNHFIELQRDTLGRLWATVHSGSRGIGAHIAGHHARLASDPKGASRAGEGGSALPLFEAGSAQAAAFMSDLQWALEFAAENRKQMMDAVGVALRPFVSAPAHDGFDIAHNIISEETHGGRTLFVHRKGAMPAPAGARGIIPGSMGTASYIVEGRGNTASYGSSSHGAGRVLSRGEAHARISIKDVRRAMKDVVYPAGRGMEAALIEEAPAAYKNIKEVLAQQEDLVTPVLRLEPMAVVKGK